MKNLRLLHFALIISLVVVFTSCEKKEDGNKTTEEQLLGKWTGDEYHEDGVLSDFNAFFKGVSSVEFKEDGSGASISFAGEQSMTWSYDETTKILHMETAEIDLGDGVKILGDTIDAEISKIDASNLWLAYDDEGTACEERYIK